jgi:hypothetical protein
VAENYVYTSGSGIATFYANLSVQFFPKVETSIADQPELPSKVRLRPNYPNPFNPTTQIEFALPESQPVTLEVYNTLGQRVRTLLDKQMPAGNHSVTFDAAGLPSGVYLYRLQADKVQRSQKMLLVK